MTGIMVAVAGGTQNVIYAAGLYNNSYGVETSPIDYSTSSSGGTSLNFTFSWIGYFRPASTGTVNLSVAGSYTEFVQNIGQYNWGGGGYVNGYLWLGPTAISGYNAGNANTSFYNNTGTYSPSLVAGINYPIRLQMTMVLPYDPQAYYTGGFFGQYWAGWANGAFNFLVNSSTNVTNLIWYNTRTNGF